MIKDTSKSARARHLGDTIPLDTMKLRRPLDVFLVEDEGLIRERIINKIGGFGRVNVIGYAESASIAEEALKELHCDLIILDLELTRGTGFNVLRAIRARAGIHQPWIIVFTHFNDPHFRKQALDLGADFFLDKAQDLGRLSELIDRLPIEGRNDPE